MIGATLSTAVILWLASSFVEYKIVKSSPKMQYWFHGVPGILISIAISLSIGLVLAPAAGLAVQLAAFMGLATNEFTYKLYDSLARANNYRKTITQKVTNFKISHPKVFNEAVEGVKAGLKTIGAILFFVVWLFGLPVRIARWIESVYNRTSTAVRTALPSR